MRHFSFDVSYSYSCSYSCSCDVMKRPTPAGDCSEGQQRAHDRKLTKENKKHSKNGKNAKELLPKLSKLIFFRSSDHQCFLFIFALTFFVLLVSSVVNFNMVSTRLKRQQKKRLLSQLRECNTEFMIGRNRHETQPGNRANAMDKNTTPSNADISIQVNSSQVDIHTLEKNFANKVRSGVDNVMTSVDTGVQDAVLTSMEILVIPRVELAIKLFIASSGRGVASVVLDPDWKEGMFLEMSKALK